MPATPIQSDESSKPISSRRHDPATRGAAEPVRAHRWRLAAARHRFSRRQPALGDGVIQAADVLSSRCRGRCPDGLPSGEWVHTGDARDARFFIPLHGIVGTPRQILVNEALAARSKRKVSQIAAEDRATIAKEMVLWK